MLMLIMKIYLHTVIILNEEGRKASFEKYGANSFTKEKGTTLLQKILESLRTSFVESTLLVTCLLSNILYTPICPYFITYR